MKLPLSLDHIERMTDARGMLEHCIIATPDAKEGYATDDNARALQLALRIQPYTKKLNTYIPVYLNFLLSAKTEKGFHQDMEQDLSWKNDAGVHDGFARAMHALAECSNSAPEKRQRETSNSTFNEMVHLAESIQYIRTASHMISALTVKIKKDKDGGHVERIKKLSHLITRSYENHAEKNWRWFEDAITYDNARMPKALFEAYSITHNEKLLRIAQESLDFLIQQTYDEGKKYFSFVGFKGWFEKGKKKADFGQQPIEAGTTVEACVKAYEITKEKKYASYALDAFAWYNGKNISNISLVDQNTGGIMDGINKNGLNPNEGAECVLGYFIAWLDMKTNKIIK